MRRSIRLRMLPFAIALAATAAGSAHSSPPSRGTDDVERLANELMLRTYRADGPGAAVLVARGDRVLFRGARGEADIETHAPLQPGSMFRIGSVTKQFTAAGLLKLVEAGRVRLDDSLASYLPDFPGGDRITLRQLLNHTAGVREYSGLRGFLEGTARQDLTTAQVLGLFRGEAPDFAPGASWSYSNSGYALIGAVIEAVTRMPWHEYLERTLFRPLGMRATGYGHDPRFASRMVRGYTFDGARAVPMRPMSMTGPHAAGALLSNVDDLLLWSRALHKGRVLRDSSYAAMITPTGKAADAGIHYGFGLYNDTVRGRPMLWHGGRIFGFIASLSYLPGPDITVVVLENDDARNGIEEAADLARRLAAIALGEPYPLPVPVAVDSTTLRAAEGTYRFDGEVRRTLRVVAGHLTSQRGTRDPVPLTPIAADEFLLADGFTRLTLERGPDGEIHGVRFFPRGEGDGEPGTRTNEAPPAPAGVQVPRSALERLVGRFADDRLEVSVFLDGGILRARIVGQPAVGLRARSPLLFMVEDADAALEFSAGDGPATALIIRQNGREATLTRAER